MQNKTSFEKSSSWNVITNKQTTINKTKQKTRQSKTTNKQKHQPKQQQATHTKTIPPPPPSLPHPKQTNKTKKTTAKHTKNTEWPTLMIQKLEQEAGKKNMSLLGRHFYISLGPHVRPRDASVVLFHTTGAWRRLMNFVSTVAPSLSWL